MTVTEIVGSSAFQLGMAALTVSPFAWGLLSRRRKRKPDPVRGIANAIDAEARRIAKRRAKEEKALERKRAKERKEYATGGIVTGRIPTAAEHAPETIVPLPGGRRIPVNTDPVVPGLIVGGPVEATNGENVWIFPQTTTTGTFNTGTSTRLSFTSAFASAADATRGFGLSVEEAGNALATIRKSVEGTVVKR